MSSLSVCDYYATFGSIGSQSPYREACDNYATYGLIGTTEVTLSNLGTF